MRILQVYAGMFACFTRHVCSLEPLVILFALHVYVSLHYSLPCPALPCRALPCPALPCPALPCPPVDALMLVVQAYISWYCTCGRLTSSEGPCGMLPQHGWASTICITPTLLTSLPLR